MGGFPNEYWSYDYRTGIEGLSLQSVRSIRQLHDLRKLIFSYVQYYHHSSEALTKIEMDASENSTLYRRREGKKTIFSKHPAIGMKETPGPSRTVSEVHRKVDMIKNIDAEKAYQLEDKGDERINEQDTSLTLDSAFSLCLDNVYSDSKNLMYLASLIDKEILERVTSFIKFHEPKINEMIESLENAMDDCEKAYGQLEQLKREHEEQLRLREFNRLNLTNVEKALDQKEAAIHEHEENSGETYESASDDDELNDSAKAFNYPLLIGGVLKIQSQEMLVALLDMMLKSINTSRRKIPLPGYRNEIFSSEQLCEWLSKKRPFGFNPSRLNLEKFGQGLLDLELIITTNFWPRKFRSESMWFEWSDLTVYIVNNSSKTVKSQPVAENSNEEFLALKEVAQNTSRTFNSLFQSVRLSWRKGDVQEQIKDTEERYKNSYLNLETAKYNMESLIRLKTAELEAFERNRIKLSYLSLAKVQEMVYNAQMFSTSRLLKFVENFSQRTSQTSNYDLELESLVNKFSTGIYSPSMIFPKDAAKRQTSISQSNNCFQSLKYKFNLLQDVQLQLPMNSNEAQSMSVCFNSLPLFLYTIIREAEHKVANLTELSSSWTSPLDFANEHILKQEILIAINSYDMETDGAISNELEAHNSIMKSIFESLKAEPHTSLINFLKFWLLEISDSLIPCLVYDSFMGIYENLDENRAIEEEALWEKIIHLFNSVPRSNLSSLIFLMEHICKVFELPHNPNYGKNERAIADDPIPCENDVLREVSEKLNSVETIGSIPFVHLILRPSLIKNSTGYKAPIDKYKLIMQHLLNPNLRSRLYSLLVYREENYISRKENEKNAFNEQIKKLSQSQEVHHHARTNSRHQRPASSEEFSLRPFRTKTGTPISPRIGSPTQGPSITDNEKETNLKDAARERSSSDSVLKHH